jgi:hypothetical protein
MPWSLVSRRLALAAAIAAIAIVGVSACGGSSKAGSASPGSPSAGKSPTNSIGGNVGDIIGGVTQSTGKYCSAIKTADVQVLVKATVAQPVVEPDECDWLGGQLKVTIYANDSSEKYYKEQSTDLGAGTALSGVGDEAAIIEPIVGKTTPSVIAHKGSLTCNATSPSEMSDTTMTYTGSSPFYDATPASETAYAAKLGVLCADVFSAGS